MNQGGTQADLDFNIEQVVETGICDCQIRGALRRELCIEIELKALDFLTQFFDEDNALYRISIRKTVI